MASLWGGRFEKDMDELVKKYNASIFFDQRMYNEDIDGSIAHVTMLGKQGIVSEEDKESLFDAIDTWKATIDIFAKMLDKTEFRMDQIQKQLGKGFLNATDIAEHFAKQGIPFREAHAIVGHMVKVCENKSCDFEDLTDEELQAIDKRVTKETLGDISIKTCVNARMSFGGTAPSEVRRQIEVGRQWLNGLER